MEPVEPSMASVFMRGGKVPGRSPESRGQHEAKIVPDHRCRQNQSIDAVEYATVAGQQRTGILKSVAPLIGGLQQVARLCLDIGKAGYQHGLKRVRIKPAKEKH